MEYSVINHIHLARFRHMRGINRWTILRTANRIPTRLSSRSTPEQVCTKVLFVSRSDECLEQERNE